MIKAIWSACIVGGLGILLAAVLFHAVPMPFGRASTLARQFPALARLPETRKLRVEIGWTGLSPLSPSNATYLLELQNDQFAGVGEFKVATQSMSRTVSVPRDAVRSFLAAASNVEMVEKDYEARITHTDDYPSLGFDIDTEGGLLEIGTSSQLQRADSADYFDRSPWAIYYAHRTFVVTASDLDRAFDAMAPDLKYEETRELLVKKAGSRS